MSQLDAMLKKLNAVLAESGEPVKIGVKEEDKYDPKAALVIKEFVVKNMSLVKAHEQAGDDPRVVLERRKALSTFVGSNLTNNGVAVLSGTINMQNLGHHKPAARAAHGKKDAHGKAAAKEAEPIVRAPLPPVAPAPQIVMTVCPSCVQAEALAKSAAADKAAGIEAPPSPAPKVEEKPAAEAKPAATAAASSAAETGKAPKHGAADTTVELAPEPKKSIGMDMGMSMGGFSSFSRPLPAPPAQAQVEAPPAKAAEATPKPAAEPPKAAAEKPKNVVASLFSAFGGNKGSKDNKDNKDGKENAASEPAAAVAPLISSPAAPEAASPAASAPVKSQVIWFKHFQAVESALRIGDSHFADSVVSVLYEAAISLSAEPSIVARIESLRARVLIDRKQYPVAEKVLNDTINNIKGTDAGKNIAAAYCWHALAQCYKDQKDADKSAEAHKKAIAIAEASLGPDDPETMQFKAPLV